VTFGLAVSNANAAPAFFHFDDASANLGADPSPMDADSIGLAVADVDNDGDMDIMVAEGTASIKGIQNKLLLNNGHGVFTDASATHLPQIENNSAGVDFGDVDGDGDVDAIVANVGPNQLLLNDGHGHFSDASSQLPPPLSFFSDISAQAIFSDVDGDGDLDIFVCNEVPFPGAPVSAAQNRLWINDGKGNFTDQTAARLPQVLDNSANVRFADINGDGWVDAVVANNGQNSVLINQGGGYFIDEGVARLGALEDSSRSLALADVDGDGDLDVMFANSRGQQDRLYLNDGSGHFVDVTATRIPASLASSTSVQLADFDCDGDMDAFITTLNTGALHNLIGAANHFLMNTGNGHFVDVSQIVLPGVEQVSFDAAVTNFNADHSLDIIVANSVGQQETLLLSARDKQAPNAFDEAWKNVFKNQCE